MSYQEILQFEWDESKNIINQKKHGISFSEVLSVFQDSNILSMFDPDHSQTEERWISMGRSLDGKILVISHTFRQNKDNEEQIRIISARSATKQEEIVYYKGAL